jgi:hypothetical protein
LCNGESYCYTWSNGATSRIIDNLAAGTFSVTVTDKNGCVIFGTATVTEPTALDITSVQIEPANNGNYKLTVFATGGTTPYRYKRIPGNPGYQVSNIFNNVPAGNYQIVVRDNKLCTDTVEVEVPGEGGENYNLVLPEAGDFIQTEEVSELLMENEEAGAIPSNGFGTSNLTPRLFPNPAVHEVNLKVDGDYQEGELLLIDLQGRTVIRQSLEANTHVKLDVTSFSVGLYLVKIQLDGAHFSEKLLIAERQ